MVEYECRREFWERDEILHNKKQYQCLTIRHNKNLTNRNFYATINKIE